MEKKYQHELERHMSILTAPNYNLNVILGEYLIGPSSPLINNQIKRNSKFKNIKRSSKFIPHIDNQFGERDEDLNNKSNTQRAYFPRQESKNGFLSTDNLGNIEIPNASNAFNHNFRLNDEFLNKNQIIILENNKNKESNIELHENTAENQRDCKLNSSNINIFVSDLTGTQSVPINTNNENLRDAKVSKSAEPNSISRKSIEITNQVDVETSEFNIFHPAEVLRRNSNIVQEKVTMFDHYIHESLSHSNRVINLGKLKRALQKEVNKLKDFIDKNKDSNDDINKKCNIVAMEKIELIEETEAVDNEINNILKQKQELIQGNLNLTNSTEGNNNTGNSEPTVSSSREISKGSNNSQPNSCNTAPNLLGIDIQKLKKIQELKSTFSNMEKMLEEAKGKAKEKEQKNKQFIQENNDLKLRIEQKKLVLNQYKSEITYMKNKLEEKKGKESTPKKIFGVFKNIFSSKAK